MLDEESRARSGVAVAEPPDDSALEMERKKSKKKDGENLEYEVEFATPFGKLEFELEPLAKKEKKDRERKAKAEREAAKKAARAAERAAAKAAARAERSGRGFFGTLMIVLAVFALIGAGIAIVYWLFARPGDEDDDAVPPEFAQQPEPAPQSFVERARDRLQSAVRAGRRASREAQREQREKFEQMSRSGR